MKTTLLWIRTLVAASLLASAACGSNATPTSPTAVTSPTTINWSSFVGPSGAASRSFVTSDAGTVAVALESATVPLGVGLGVTPASGTGCVPAVSWTLSPGEQAPPTPVDQGTYCLLVFDVGRIASDQVQFTVTLEYP